MEGKWKVGADLVFPLVTTAQRPDLVVWSDERRCAVILELTVPWEENFAAAEARKEDRYQELLTECREEGWDVEYYHLAVGVRGYVEGKLMHLFKRRFNFSNAEMRSLRVKLQETAERASFFIWLKREDPVWLE